MAPQTLLKPATKEVVADAASGGEWVNRTPWQVIRMWVNRSAPGDIRNSVSVVEAPYPVLIGIVVTSLPCGLNTS